MTRIEELKKEYPGLIYDDGWFFLNEYDLIEGDFIIEDMGGSPESLIAEYYDNWEICDNPNEPDPTKERMIQVDGHTYIKNQFNGDYNEALKNI